MAVGNSPYDFRQALYAFAPGVVPTREVDAALAAQYAANGNTPLTQAQVLAITGPLPAFPAGLPRFADSNPASDDWSIEKRGAPLG